MKPHQSRAVEIALSNSCVRKKVPATYLPWAAFTPNTATSSFVGMTLKFGRFFYILLCRMQVQVSDYLSNGELAAASLVLLPYGGGVSSVSCTFSGRSNTWTVSDSSGASD